MSSSPFVKTRIYRNAFLGLLGAFLLLNPGGARADTYHVTLINVTFAAPCIGLSSTCTEVANGSGDYNPIANTVSNLSLQLTGTLNVLSFVYGTPPSCASGCFTPPTLYDPGALAGFNPIELDVSISNLNAPTPQPIDSGVNGTLLFVPVGCGGDQSACNTLGAFPGSATTRYTVTSGTYTSVDLTPTPEPGSAILLVTGLLGLLTQRGCRKFL